MSKIQVVKRVSLDFIGERYVGSFINLRAISMREREEMLVELDKIKDPKKSVNFVRDTVIERFVDGQFKDGTNEPTAISSEDLLDFPAEVFLQAIKELQGNTDPKS